MVVTRKKVLIVEDEEILRDVYSLVLSTKGFDVQTAINGSDGLKKMREESPDIVLLDVMMPIMDGKQFMQTVDLTEYPNTKIIVYSNMSDRLTEDEMLKLGAERFVLKSSMTPADLVGIVTSVVQ